MTTWGIVWRVAFVVLSAGAIISMYIYATWDEKQMYKELFSNIRKRKRIVWLHDTGEDECKKNLK